MKMCVLLLPEGPAFALFLLLGRWLKQAYACGGGDAS